MRKWAWPFICLACITLLGSLCLHIAELFGLATPSSLAVQAIDEYLNAGLIPAMLATIVACVLLGRRQRNRGYEYQTFLRSRYPWLKYAGLCLMIYALSWLLFSAGESYRSLARFRANSANMIAWSVYSIYWMYCYSRPPKDEPWRQCINGHKVPAWAEHCELCGSQFITATPG